MLITTVFGTRLNDYIISHRVVSDKLVVFDLTARYHTTLSFFEFVTALLLYKNNYITLSSDVNCFGEIFTGILMRMAEKEVFGREIV